MKNATTNRRIILWVLLVGFLPSNARAQEFTGNIVGTVVDSSAGVMPGVTVTVSGETIQGTRTTVSESNGTYRITLLPPGTYQVVYRTRWLRDSHATRRTGRSWPDKSRST